MPYGAHGVFAALPAGVVFALQGFEQAIQLAGEAKRPQRDVSGPHCRDGRSARSSTCCWRSRSSAR